MNALFSTQQFFVLNYRRLAQLLFSVVSSCTILIYLTLQLVIHGKLLFHPVEIFSLPQFIGIEMALTISVTFLLFLFEQIERKGLKKRILGQAFFMAAILFSLQACEAQSAPKMYHNAATGMQTNAVGLTTTKTTMVMNGEVLGHNQIPLGEKFTIINEGVSGLTQKGDNVSIGCALTITDTKGTVLLKSADLFAATDLFPVAESKYLKCIVNTGKPMKWNEKYLITTTFWDKWGKGKITNRVSIETIDLP